MRKIYIAECDQNGGVYTYDLYADGRAVLLSKTDADRPMYLAKQNGKLYVLLREAFPSNMSGLAVYGLDAAGNIKEKLYTVPVHGVCGCHLCVTKQEEVYIVNYLSGNVVRLPDQVVSHKGTCGPNRERQDMPHTHFVGQTPEGQYMAVTDLGLDTITLYDKALHQVTATHLPPGSGPRHLAFSEDGQTLFCVNELSSTVSALAYKDGTLQLLDTVSILPKDYRGFSTAAAIRVQGGLIYASNRGHDSIACLSFSERKLHLLNIASCGGSGPRDFNLFDDLLVCTNEGSNNVTFFRVNGAELTKLDTELSLKGPLCVIG